MASLNALFQRLDFGLLWIRLTVGGFFAFQGLSKFLAGGDTLRGVGSAIGFIGIPAETDSTMALVLGGLAAAAELLGGAFVIVGFLFRSALVALLAVMIVATTMLYQTSEADIGTYGFPMILGSIVFGLIWTGAGRFAVTRQA